MIRTICEKLKNEGRARKFVLAITVLATRRRKFAEEESKTAPFEKPNPKGRATQFKAYPARRRSGTVRASMIDVILIG